MSNFLYFGHPTSGAVASLLGGPLETASPGPRPGAGVSTILLTRGGRDLEYVPYHAHALLVVVCGLWLQKSCGTRHIPPSGLFLVVLRRAHTRQYVGT
mgnify:CR=1 FL=1